MKPTCWAISQSFCQKVRFELRRSRVFGSPSDRSCCCTRRLSPPERGSPHVTTDKSERRAAKEKCVETMWSTFLRLMAGVNLTCWTYPHPNPTWPGPYTSFRNKVFIAGLIWKGHVREGGHQLTSHYGGALMGLEVLDGFSHLRIPAHTVEGRNPANHLVCIKPCISLG